MRGFYVLLAAVAIGGAGWLIYSARDKPKELPAATTPLPAAPAGSFQGYVLGNDSAPVHITEYSDFECPFCASFATVQMPEIREQLINTGKVQWRFRDFPLSNHEYARVAALAALCAGEQGKFWEMHDQLFYNHQWAQRRKNPSGLFRDFAKTIGLDVNRYNACMDSRRYDSRIEASRQEGDALGVNHTPSFFVNGRPFTAQPNSDAFQALVDSLTARPKR